MEATLLQQDNRLDYQKSSMWHQKKKTRKLLLMNPHLPFTKINENCEILSESDDVTLAQFDSM